MNQEQCLVILGDEVGQVQPDVSIRKHYVKYLSLLPFTLQSGGKVLYRKVDSSSNFGARCLYGKAMMMGTMFDYIYYKPRPLNLVLLVILPMFRSFCCSLSESLPTFSSPCRRG